MPDNYVPKVHITDLILSGNSNRSNILAHFNCDLEIVHLFGCVLNVNPMRHILACGPLTAYKGQRAAYISRPEILKAMLIKVLPLFVAAGGNIPAGTSASAFNLEGGELDGYLR